MHPGKIKADEIWLAALYPGSRILSLTAAWRLAIPVKRHHKRVSAG
jgi:hypothetical protein